MLLIARKNLLVHKGRFLLALSGVAFSVMLMLLLMSLYAGWREHMSAYLRHVRADLWVGQKGASDLFQTLSLLPAAGEQLFYQAEEVDEVSSFVGRLMTCTVRGHKCHTFIVGVSDANNGPVALVTGRPATHSGEIVIDQVFARKERVRLGETLTVADKALQVVGIARGGNCFLYQYAFVTLAQARQLFGLDGMVNYFLVRLVPTTVNLNEAAARIEQSAPIPVSAYSKEQFIANNLSLTGDNFLPILRVLETIGFLVGTAVISLTVYALTVERSPEYGVLKAVGAADRVLYTTVAIQACLCGLLGWLVGIPLTWSVIALAQYAVPQFPAASDWHHALWMLGTTLGMSLLAAVIPARRVARIDPLVAFKG
jgi:putative ABC transport system permease protein